MSKKPKLVYIQWVDACSNNSWFSDQEAREWAYGIDWVVEEVGWIIEETPDYILLGSRRVGENKNVHPTWGLLQKIPKPWILKRKAIKL